MGSRTARICDVGVTTTAQHRSTDETGNRAKPCSRYHRETQCFRTFARSLETRFEFVNRGSSVQSRQLAPAFARGRGLRLGKPASVGMERGLPGAARRRSASRCTKLSVVCSHAAPSHSFAGHCSFHKSEVYQSFHAPTDPMPGLMQPNHQNCVSPCNWPPESVGAQFTAVVLLH